MHVGTHAFRHPHRHTHTHYICESRSSACVCVCSCYVQWPVRWRWQPAGLKARQPLSLLPVFPTSLSPPPLRGSKVIVFRYIHVCSAAVCQQDLGGYIRQEIVDFSSSVLDQRPTISKAASLSQCLPNVCPRSSTENFDTVPKVPRASPHPPLHHPTSLWSFNIDSLSVKSFFFFLFSYLKWHSMGFTEREKANASHAPVCMKRSFVAKKDKHFSLNSSLCKPPTSDQNELSNV